MPRLRSSANARVRSAAPEGRVANTRTAVARSRFDKTWWGTQWLQALSEIDNDNRLPRGRTYANKGAVLEMRVPGRKITAQIQGSRPRPYAVSVTVPPRWRPAR